MKEKITLEMPMIDGMEITVTTPYVRDGETLKQRKSTHVWRAGKLVFVSSNTSVLSAASMHTNENFKSLKYETFT